MSKSIKWDCEIAIDTSYVEHWELTITGEMLEKVILDYFYHLPTTAVAAKVVERKESQGSTDSE